MTKERLIELAKQAGWPDSLVAPVIMAKLAEFAELVRADEREACGRVRAAKPRELKPVGRGGLLDEQQFCFDKGWRKGAASVRAAIRSRGSNT